MRYFIVAGERSGDLHASNLVKALKNNDPEAEVFGWGGELMEAAGAKVLRHYKDISFMGFAEVITHFTKIVKALKQCKKDIENVKPDVFIPVDFAGFNMKIAGFANKRNIPVYYYISPKVWAWNQSRAYKIKKLVQHMFVILPFEVGFYKKYGVNSHYIGNPILDAIASFRPNPSFGKNLPAPVIAILPGSRKQEVRSMASEVTTVIKNNPHYQFVIAGVSSLPHELYKPFLSYGNTSIVYDKTYDLLNIAKAAVVTSGTATLETALFEVPQVVVYKANPITYMIVKRLIKVDWISLVNLIADKGLVPELIQDKFTPDLVNVALDKLVRDTPERAAQLSGYKELKKTMGESGASEKAAALMVDLLRDSFKN
ncbi:lipid-A-disaccharide synthase [Cytophagaceae bacterium ABcell3]|nr:lipid-A-disaccharide synthase [Cytophagaceae bacterium ABcell3]